MRSNAPPPTAGVAEDDKSGLVGVIGGRGLECAVMGRFAGLYAVSVLRAGFESFEAYAVDGCGGGLGCPAAAVGVAPELDDAYGVDIGFPDDRGGVPGDVLQVRGNVELERARNDGHETRQQEYGTTASFESHDDLLFTVMYGAAFGARPARSDV